VPPRSGLPQKVDSLRQNAATLAKPISNRQTQPDITMAKCGTFAAALRKLQVLALRLQTLGRATSLAQNSLRAIRQNQKAFPTHEPVEKWKHSEGTADSRT